MGLSLNELVELYILQAEYHRAKPSSSPEPHAFEQQFELLMTQYRVTREDRFAPPLKGAKGQPAIPFLLFKPAAAADLSPKPLIIHTHGGPDVYMDKRKPHAEIAYFLSQGFVVACPNYRGSSRYPDTETNPPEWEEWIAKSKDKHHLLGPEDVYAVAQCAAALSFVQADKIFLRGGSFGSHINAHLLAAIKAGKYKNIFSGAHLSGGIHYPLPHELPADFPLLISHGMQDEVADFANARLFMEKVLLREVLREAEDKKPSKVRVFMASFGNHHLIAGWLTPQNFKNAAAYEELKNYLLLATSFIEQLSQKNEFTMMDVKGQLAIVFDSKAACEDNYAEVEVAEAMKTLGHLMKEAKEEKSDPAPQRALSVTPHTPSLSPTMAHLKLVLGRIYTGRPLVDMWNFLLKKFSPIDWEAKKNELLIYAGKDVCQDQAFVRQMVKVIEEEKSFLETHPDYMVMYHAADNSTVQLYSFITQWRNMLRGRFGEDPQKVDEMRAFDFLSHSFDDVEVFLQKMRQQKKDTDKVFNNIAGFSERALACIPALTSNQHTTASCSLWWHFRATLSSGRAPNEAVVSDLLSAVGIFSASRANRYKDLFAQDQGRLSHQGKGQSVLQQIFVPYQVAEKMAYVCQLWGYEFDQSDKMGLSKPSIIKRFCQDPEDFEAQLQSNVSAFKNYGDLKSFGGAGFIYANTLQLRYLYRPREDQQIKSYFRRSKHHAHFAARLAQLVKEDYADFMVTQSTIPRALVAGAREYTLKLRADLGFKKGQETSFNLVAKQQVELYKGLVQNPHRELYGNIQIESAENKKEIQRQLWNARFFNESTPKHLPLYAVCRHVKGYTYYDFLNETAQKILKLADYSWLMMQVDQLTVPLAADTVDLSEDDYLRLSQLFESLNNSGPDMADVKNVQYPLHENGLSVLVTLRDELLNAMNAVLKVALAAKKRGCRQDVAKQRRGLYS